MRSKPTRRRSGSTIARGAWPWAYRATQRITLDGLGATIALAVTNHDPERAMLVGAGIHPYFHRHAESRIVTAATAWWRNDATGVAIERVAEARFDGEPVSVASLKGTDHFFESANPRVRIEDHRGAIDIAGSGAGFHLYVPKGNAFCVEPVTHPPDSFGRGEYAPGDRLAPGERREWTFRIAVAA